MNVNAITQKDGYKADHRSQYPVGTQLVVSNFTPRSTKHSVSTEHCDDKIVFFGLQYFIKWFLQEEFGKFFKSDKTEAVKKYKRRMDGYLGEGAIKTDHIEQLHDLGYIPISIRALPEGATINERVPVLVIENTLPEFFWLTNFLETVMSCMLWKPSTSATTARKYRCIMEKFAEETGAPKELIPFNAHDFSFRGMSGIQDAMMSGAGHLLSFVGTDSIPAIDFLEDYYHADCEKELIGCSVPATEHSVMCMGTKDNEIETFRRLITEIYPHGIVSIVSDTWDFWKVVTEFMPKLKEEIMNRVGGFPLSKVVLRPDSGDPVDIICGTGIKTECKPTVDECLEYHNAGFSHVYYEENGHIRFFEIKNNLQISGSIRLPEIIPETKEEEAKIKGAIECLWETFGGTKTDKGFRMLDTHIGLIYGDSITIQRCEEILLRLKLSGFASTNVVLGVGSFTYEYVTRDTLGWAMKATAGIVNGEFREIFKDPKTDDGIKKSAVGYLAVFKDDKGEYQLRDRATREEMENCEFVEVFRDGKIKREYTLAEIRDRIYG